jgi:O-antigen ligase
VRYGDFQNTGRNRFVSAAIDFQDIKDYPLTGVGRSVATRYQRDVGRVKRHRNNGVTDFAAKFGLVGFTLYFLSMLKSLKVLCKFYKRDKSFAYATLLVVLLIGSSQIIFLNSFFISLIFLHLTYGNYIKSSITSINK